MSNDQGYLDLSVHDPFKQAHDISGTLHLLCETVNVEKIKKKTRDIFKESST